MLESGDKNRQKKSQTKLNFCLNLKDCTIHFALIISLIGAKFQKLNGGVAFNSDQKVYKPYWTNTIDSNITYFNSEETAEKVCSVLNKEIENETL